MTTRPGYLHVIAGPMFAGKTMTLMDEIRRQEATGNTVEIITHAIDDRHAVGNIATHHGDFIPARAFTDIHSLVDAISDTTNIIAIDEAQFFGNELVDAVRDLVSSGRHIIISGLAVTFDGQPFEPMPSLMALADQVDKLVAACAICDGPAPYHQPVEEAFLTDPLHVTSDQIGGSNIYQARCRTHFTNYPAYKETTSAACLT